MSKVVGQHEGKKRKKNKMIGLSEQEPWRATYSG